MGGFRELKPATRWWGVGERVKKQKQGRIEKKARLWEKFGKGKGRGVPLIRGWDGTFVRVSAYEALLRDIAVYWGTRIAAVLENRV